VAVFTIGQLSFHTGVAAKTVRFYHSIGLLPEPARDASGYRRYTAADAILLLRVRTLAEAGVPLAQVRALLEASPPELARSIRQIDHELGSRIEHLQRSRRRLRKLADPAQTLPPGVAEYLELLNRIGLSEGWVIMERDLWILVFAAHPEEAAALLADQHQAKTLPAVQQIYRDYDRSRDLDPDDPRLAELADRIIEQARSRYADQPPSPPQDSPVPALIQDLVNGTSPAWRKLDSYLRARLG
jgi:DNA-binding transcriptional MerR regulator